MGFPLSAILVVFLVVLDGTAEISREAEDTLILGVIVGGYILKLNVGPDPGPSFTFEGTVNIRISPILLINLLDIHIGKNLNFSLHSSIANDWKEILRFKESDIVRLVSKTRLRLDKNMTINFGGKIRKDEFGLHQISYETPNKEKHWVFATNFEPFYARTAFPCFDEPEYKARFSLTLEHNKDQRAISNMAQESSQHTVGGRIANTFSWTPAMTPYKLAFVIGDFERVPNTGKICKVWAPQHCIEQLSYAGDFAAKALDKIADIVQTPYSDMKINKLDIVAIPNIESGPEASWGIITFRAEDVMIATNESSELATRSAATVIACKLASQWFGGYVSPAWWSDLWFIGGLATFFGLLGTDSVEPSWLINDLFPSMCNQHAMQQEALPTARPMSDSALLHKANFDEWIYQAGAARIRMIQYSMPDAKFSESIKYFFSIMKFVAARQQDFAFALLKVFPSAIPIMEVMHTWTYQTGYPMISVVRNKTVVVVTQKRHHSQQNASIGDTSKWWIPLTWTTGKELDFTWRPPQAWLNPNQNSQLDIPNVSTDDWIIFNLNNSGYYRVMYEPSEWEKFTEYLQGKHRHLIHHANHAALLDDALTFAQGGYLDYDIALDMTLTLRFYRDFRDSIIWNSAYRHLAYLKLQMAKTDGGKLMLNRFILDLVGPIMEYFDYEEVAYDTSLDKITRGQIANLACQAGDPECQKWIFPDNYGPNQNHTRRSNEVIKPDLRLAVYCQYIETSNIDWEAYWQNYEDATFASEKSIILEALACIPDKQILQKYLKKLLGVNPRDGSVAFSHVAQKGGMATSTALNFLDENFQKIAGDYNRKSFGRVLFAIGKSIIQQKQLDQFTDMIEKNSAIIKNTGMTETAKLAVQAASANVQWSSDYYIKVEGWLKKRYDINTTDAPSKSPYTAINIDQAI